MNKTYVLSLRAFLMLLMGLLVVVALGFAASNLQQNWSIYRKASLLVERNRIADSCLRSVANFAYERGRINVVLRSQSPVSPENLRFINEHRLAADQFIELALKNLPVTAQGKGDEVQNAWDAVKALRLSADRDMSSPLEMRDRQLLARWMNSSDSLIDKLEVLLRTVSSISGGLDAVFDRMSDLRVQALRFRILVGREATLFGGELSSQRVSDRAMINSAHQIHGQIVQVWSLLESGAERLGDVAFSQVVAQAQSKVFWVLRPLQEEILRVSERQQPAALPIDQYLRASTQALDSTVQLAEVISRSAERYTQQLLDRAKWYVVASLGGIVAILLLCGFAARLVARRFTRPLNEVLRRIDKLLLAQSSPVRTEIQVAGRDELGKVQQALAILDETIAARMKSEAALRESEGVSASILACAPQAIVCTDGNGTITVFSPGAERMLGYSATEMLGKQTPLIFHDSAEIRERAAGLSGETGQEIEAGFGLFIARLKMLGEPDESEWTLVRKDGSRLTVMLAVTFLRDVSGEVRGCLGVATDITERTATAARISQMAYYDHLTQLPNSRLLHDRLSQAMIQSRRDGGRLALMLIDLDKFKPVNDNFGHAVGDILLKTVAERMLSCLRESDTLARVGGDEFVVVLPGIASGSDALGVGEKIRLELNEPFTLEGGYTVSIACSIGVAIFPEHGADEKLLRRCADEAMYVSKGAGRNCVTLFGGVPGGVSAFMTGDEPSVLRLVWHKSYQCGEASIDHEHRHLFDQANRLIRAMMQGEMGNEQLLLLLDQLIRDTTVHFSHEEEILARYGYTDLNPHVLHHQRLVGRAQELRKMATAGELTIGDLVTFMAQEVVLKHMLTEDIAYFQPLRRAMHQQRTEPDGHGKY